MRTQTRFVLGVLIAFVALLLFYQTPLMRRVRVATWEFIVPTVARLAKVGSLSIEPDVAAQLTKLQSENVSLRSQLRDYTHLRDQLGTPNIQSMRTIPAAVLGRPVDTYRSQFIISRGITQGVAIGAPVVVNGTTLIGFITDVSQNISTVQLLLHPQTNLTAEVVPDDGEAQTARGLLRGQHFTSLSVSTIPRDITIAEGQAVVTVANEHIPYGLFIGTVGSVTAFENEPYQAVTVRLSYDADAIDAVNVLVQP